MGMLDTIVANKREELAERRRRVPPAELRRRAADAPPGRPFHAALTGRDVTPGALDQGRPRGRSADIGSSGRDVTPGALDQGRPRGAPAGIGTSGRGIRLIAEVKSASPSAGTIRAEFDPAAIAGAYARAGAAAISVLTDARFFHGADEHLTRARAAAGVPALRKDFTLESYQVYEARAIGADAVLLIAAILDQAALADLAALAGELGMAALVEVHTEAELDTALAAVTGGSARGTALVGINNRNLDTLATSLDVTRRLRPRVPAGVTVVAESGIEERRDVEEMERLGVHAVLVGTALMRSPDPGGRVRELLGTRPEKSFRELAQTSRIVRRRHG